MVKEVQNNPSTLLISGELEAFGGFDLKKSHEALSIVARALYALINQAHQTGTPLELVKEMMIAAYKLLIEMYSVAYALQQPDTVLITPEFVALDEANTPGDVKASTMDAAAGSSELTKQLRQNLRQMTSHIGATPPKNETSLIVQHR